MFPSIAFMDKTLPQSAVYKFILFEPSQDMPSSLAQPVNSTTPFSEVASVTPDSTYT